MELVSSGARTHGHFFPSVLDEFNTCGSISLSLKILDLRRQPCFPGLMLRGVSYKAASKGGELAASRLLFMAFIDIARGLESRLGPQRKAALWSRNEAHFLTITSICSVETG